MAMPPRPSPRPLGTSAASGADEQPPLLKLTQLMGLYLRKYYNNAHYAKAQNLRDTLRQQINACLDEAHVLVVPTTIAKPSRLFENPLTTKEWLMGDIPITGEDVSVPCVNNTVPTDITGHPALVMPCGLAQENLPISIMFMGRHWDEGTLFPRGLHLRVHDFGPLPADRTGGAEGNGQRLIEGCRTRGRSSLLARSRGTPRALGSGGELDGSFRGGTMERHRIRGFVRPPTLEQVKELASWCFLNLTDEEAKEYQEIMAGALALSDRVDELPQPQFEVKYPRTPGRRPTPEEDPLNIFVTKVEVKGAPSGKLAGKRVAIKDNIALAGVPFSNGNWALADIMPDFDAIVVERLLDAGATIVGKVNQDDYSFFGTSDTSTWGKCGTRSTRTTPLGARPRAKEPRCGPDMRTLL